MKNKLFFTVSFLLTVLISAAQPNSPDFRSDDNVAVVVITWNKNTPEQEMKDDIKSFAEYGVMVKYKNVKRNERKEITAIEVSYETKIGEKGSLSYENIKPIGTVQLYKIGTEVGFGEVPNPLPGLVISSSFPMADPLMNSYKSLNSTESSSRTTTRKQILRSDRQPVIIENGKIIEGGSDYSTEELNEILSRKDDSVMGSEPIKAFTTKGNLDFSEEIRKMQAQIDALTEKQKQLEEKTKEESKKKGKK